MEIWGLTGGIGAGKSAIGKLISKQGVPLIDVDQVSRKCRYPEGCKEAGELVATFGPDCLDDKGFINRELVGKLIFKDVDARNRLESIVLPVILQSLEARLADLKADGHKVVLVEGATIIEHGWDEGLAGIIIVTAEPIQRFIRVQKRDGLEDAEVKQRMAFQNTDSQRMNGTVAPLMVRLHNNTDLDDPKLIRRIDQIVCLLRAF
jgi:dephospho-CoA kinase